MTGSAPLAPAASTSADGSGAETLDAALIPPPAVQWGVLETVQHPEATEPSRHKPRAGRRPGVVWNYFTPVRTEQNKTHAVCRFCARRCAGVAARMASHLVAKCPAVPAHERDAIAAALTLAHDPPQSPSRPEKRQRVAVDASQTGLAAFGGSDTATANGRNATHEDKALAAALPLVVVACLRAHAPPTLIDDAFFRDALTLLRPQSLPMIKAIDAATLTDTVAASVAQEQRLWLRQSESFTLAYTAAHCEWRGTDRSRHSMLLADASGASDTWQVEMETQLQQAVATDAVVGFCSDARHIVGHVRAERTAKASPLSRLTLVSRCLLTETVGLWTLVADAVPQLTATVARAAETYAAETPDGGLASAAAWSLPFRVVKRVISLSTKGDSAGLLEAEATLWQDLSAADELLSPFAWLFALSESKSVCASQFVVCWLWLVATIEQSPLVEESKRTPLADAVLTAMFSALEDHHLVAFLLDPRTRGAGFSPTGRRKAKTLVAAVATRLWPATFEPSVTSPARQALLTQLGEYMDKTGCFTDEVVWEMAQGAAPPERFWQDYVQDAPQLSALAAAVLTFVPIASQTSDLMANAASGAELFDARQIRFHFERNRANGALDMATVLAEYAELVAPSAALGADGNPPASGGEPPLAWVETVVAELQRVREAAPEDLPSTTEASTSVSGMDATWFAFHTESNRLDIDAARRRLLPAAMQASAVPPSPSPSLEV